MDEMLNNGDIIGLTIENAIDILGKAEGDIKTETLTIDEADNILKDE